MKHSPKPLFTFAVIADTHIMPNDGVETAPYRVLLKANQRAHRVVADLTELNPKFVIHVGDMVRPFPALANYDEVCDQALKLFQQLPCPVHYIPGNHDIGDKPIANAPAPNVCDAFIEKYKNKFGNTFGSFEHQGVKFILLNSSVINSGLQEEHDQWQWLDQQSQEVDGKRTFLFIHYPPYLVSTKEQPHYDNIDEPGRTRLLTLIEDMESEALFAGHVHHFFYNQHSSTDMYCLPATSFTRHDFSELFAIAPNVDAEFGRDDSAKLGYAIVDVYADRHVVRIVNSDGPPLLSLHPRDGLAPPIAVQLRHTWNEVRALPHNGPLDDFNRKKARNDYPILATWQMGITWLRVPLQDLEDEQARRRMQALCRMGQRFIVMKFGLPDDETLDLVCKHAELVGAMEIILPPRAPNTTSASLNEWRNKLNVPIYLGSMESSADLPSNDAKYFAHSTSFGCRVNEPAHIELLINGQSNLLTAFDGVLFQIPSNEMILPQIAAINELSARIDKSAMVHVMMAKQQPASAPFGQLWIANRTACACIAALSLSNGIVVLDSLTDIDRGDFPRKGLIDRRGNINLAGQYLRSLLSVLVSSVDSYHVELGDIVATDTYTCVSFQQCSHAYQLYLMHEGEVKTIQDFGNRIEQATRCIDLETGQPMINVGEASLSKALLLQLEDRHKLQSLLHCQP
ncbi:MAG: putative phosphodiesterase [Granulosicoccus sp.]|jgi:predicted phosphodiesterase